MEFVARTARKGIHELDCRHAALCASLSAAFLRARPTAPIERLFGQLPSDRVLAKDSALDVFAPLLHPGVAPVIETLSPDSSRKTSRLDDTRRIRRQKAFRLATTSGRSCSSARRLFFHDISSPIQRALDARHVAPLLAAPLAVVLGGDFSGVPVGAADKNHLQFLARDTGGSATTLLARLHVALAGTATPGASRSPRQYRSAERGGCIRPLHALALRPAFASFR